MTSLMTYLDAAQTVLRDAPAPMTDDELTGEAIRRSLIARKGKTPGATMSAALYVEVRENPNGPLVRVSKPGELARALCAVDTQNLGRVRQLRPLCRPGGHSVAVLARLRIGQRCHCLFPGDRRSEFVHAAQTAWRSSDLVLSATAPTLDHVLKRIVRIVRADDIPVA
jgi:hypothetical protein